jgi:uncharacterized protein
LPSKTPAKKKLTPVTLITGASSGIGAALAGVFAAHGHQLALTARRKEHLEDVALAITAGGGKAPHVLVADLGAPGATDKLARSLTARGLEVANLINNAGFGLYGPAAKLDANEQLAMIDLNTRALTDLVLRFAESIGRRRGGILNVASVAGFLPGQGMAVYYATKAYVISLSEALSQELGPRVRVCALCPGPVATPFMRRANAETAFPRFLYMPVEDVAQVGYQGFVRGKRVIVPGFFNRAGLLLERFIPGSMAIGGRAARLSRRLP